MAAGHSFNMEMQGSPSLSPPSLLPLSSLSPPPLLPLSSPSPPSLLSLSLPLSPPAGTQLDKKNFTQSLLNSIVVLM